MNFKSIFIAAIVLLSGGAVAEEFPTSSVNYVIPFNPGGESDITARLQQPYFEKYFNQQLIVAYQPGGGGAVSWSRLNNLKDDGSMIMGVNLPHIVVKPKQGDVGFKTDDITAVYWFHYTPDAIVVRADSPYQTLQDLISDAKNNPKKVIFSGSGKGTANHLAQVNFDKLTNVETTYVSFKGTSAAVTALLGDMVKAEWGYTTVAKAQGDSVRLLAIAMEERHPAFPDVPTFKELGVDMVSGAYRGVAVPKGASEELRQQVANAIAEINNNEMFRQQMIEAGFAMIDVPYGQSMNSFMAEKSNEYLNAARSAGIID